MRRVLIVDDKADNLYLLRALLQGHGYEVEEARHGAEALAKARQQPPGLVISDLLMPVMDGYTLLRHWKADARLNKIPFIVYTATYTEPQDEQLAIDLGANAFILKPAEPEPFLKRMGEVLEESHTRALASTRVPVADESRQLKEYSEVLIRKLEQKALELEQANHELREDVARRERVATERNRLLEEARLARAELVRTLEEQRAAEVALRESEAKFAAAFHANPTPFAILTLDGNLVEVNASFLTMLGRPREAIIGRNGVELGLVDAETRERLLKELQASDGALRDFEVNVCTHNDSVRTILLSSNVISLQGIPHHLSCCVDITNRKRAERELIESEKRYRALFENMTAGFVLFEVVQDEAGRPVDLVILAANVGFEMTTGLKKQDVLGKRLKDVLPGIEKDAAGWIETYGNIALTGQSRQFEERSEILYRDYAVAAYQPAPKQCAVTFLDVSDRKEAESALRESEARLRLSVAAADVGLWDWDLDSHAVYYSPEWKHQIGYRDDEITNHFDEWRSRVHADDLESTLQKVHEFLANPVGRHKVEYRFQHKDGSYRWILSSSDVIRDGSGKAIRMLGCHIDITERKQNEQALRMMAETLEHQVEERTADLQDRNEELDAFSRSVSHDLRAPLRAIEGFARALREDCPYLEGDGSAYLDAICVATQGMEQLIQDLLDYSRIGRAELSIRPVDLESVVEEAIQQVQLNNAAHHAEIWVDGTLPQVRAHPSTLRQVVVNLLGNAVKFVAPRVSPQVRIWSEMRGDEVRVWVEDNGIGIAAEDRERIFQVFERLHGIEEYPGTGIGLAIVRRATERMGGRCGFESTPGRGSQFWIELPS